MPLPATSAPLWDLPATQHPPLDEDRDADVVVIGAGIVGLTTAALLAEAGQEVVVLEGRAVASGTSGHTTAKASALQGTRYSLLTRQHGPEVAASYARAQQDGLEWLAEHAAPVAGAQFQRRPAITYATSVDGKRSVEQEAEAAHAAGLDVELGPTELPYATTAAVVLADQGQLDPGPYLASLADRVHVAPSGAVHEGTRVTGVHGHRRLRVVTERATIRAKHVVVATLLPITDRGFFFARAEPKSSYLVALDVDGPIPQGMYLGTDEPTRSLRTAQHEGREVLLVGGGGHATGRGAPHLARQQELVDWATEHFPVVDVVARWSAHDYVPVDHLPWVGAASPTSPGVLVATGFEKWGWTMGTAAALAFADRITGRDGVSAPWAGTFDPTRVAPRGIASAVRLNVEVAGRMAADWARPDAPPAADGTGRRSRAGVVPVGEAEPGGDRVRLVCTHLGGICSWNDAERTWDCPLHGSRFDPEGRVLVGPATRPLRRASAGKAAADADAEATAAWEAPVIDPTRDQP